MRFNFPVIIVATGLSGCALLAPFFTQEADIPWPTSEELQQLEPVKLEANGEAIIAAAAAVQERIRMAEGQSFLARCATPAAGLGVVVHFWRDNYYVVMQEWPERCGVRPGFVDGWEIYAVSREGRLLARNLYAY